MHVIQRFSVTRIYVQSVLTVFFVVGAASCLARSRRDAPAGSWYVQGSIAYTRPRKSSSSRVRTFTDPTFPADRYYPSKATGHGWWALEFGRIFPYQGADDLFDLDQISIPSMSLGLSVQDGRITEQGRIHSILQEQYGYSARVRYAALLVLARVGIWQQAQLGVSFLMGLGVSRNSASKYQETPKAMAHVRGIAMLPQKQTKFAYDLGVSVHKGLGHGLSLVASYEYLHLGKVRYGDVLNEDAHGQVKKARHDRPGLQLNLRTQLVSLGLRYAF